MMLLTFRVRNHKSIREEIVLDLVRPEVKTLTPRDGDWSSYTYPMAGIFGGNATGKSAVLDAMRYLFAAIKRSSTVWQGHRHMHRAPFALDGEARASTSMYQIEFVLSGTRHRYGFEVDGEGIKREWLLELPTLRERTLLDRDRDRGTLKIAKGGGVTVTPRELVLSRALVTGHKLLAPIAEGLVTHVDAVLVKDAHRSERLQKLTNSLAEGTTKFSDLRRLLQVADIGVTEVEVETAELDDKVLEVVKVLMRESGDSAESDTAESDTAEDDEAQGVDELSEEMVASLARRLIFTHRGMVDDCPPFSVGQESDGTIAWLALAVPALEALRRGGLLIVDEIDASLHPHLLDLLLSSFSDPQVNTKHAQLIFTSHDAYILSPLSEVELEPEQVWFTDKTYYGVTELTCQADFPKRSDANVAKRYLTGRYGGTPRLSPNLLARLVADGGSIAKVDGTEEGEL